MSWYSLAGAGLGLIGSIYGNYQQNKTARALASQANSNSIKLMEQQNAFNSAEAQKERDWMSYSNQRKLMEEAGLNPALMFGDGNLSASSAQAQGAPTPTMQVAPVNSLFNGVSFSDVASGLKSLAEAKKIGGVDTELTEQNINNAILQGENLAIANRYADRLNEQSLKEGAARIDNLFAESNKLAKEGKLIEAQEALAKANKLLTDELTRKTGAEADYQRELADNASKMVSAIIEEKSANADQSRANASWIRTKEKYEGTYAMAALTNAKAAEKAALARAALDNAIRDGKDIENMYLDDIILNNLDEQDMRIITGYDKSDYETHKSSSSSGASIGLKGFSWSTSESGSTPNRDSKLNVGDTYGVSKQRIKKRQYDRHRKSEKGGYKPKK